MSRADMSSTFKTDLIYKYLAISTFGLLEKSFTVICLSLLECILFLLFIIIRNTKFLETFIKL